MKRVRPVPLTTSPTVSVVIPCYNYGHYLPVAVESAVTNQPGVIVDVLIVDDCSTDDSFAVAEELASRHPEVRAVRNEQNSRLIATANRGLQAATGKYALLISADDALAPGALTRAAALMEAHPEVGLVYGAVDYFTTSDIPERAPADPTHWAIWAGSDWASRVFASARGPIASPEAVVRTSTMHEVGYYDAALPATSDLQMWLRFGARAGVGFIAGTTQAYYRMHGGNMSMTQFGLGGDRKELLDLTYRMDAFVSTAASYPDGARYLRAARRRVAAEALELARRAWDDPASRDYAGELVEYARTLDPQYRFSRGWLALQARKTLGPLFTRLRAEALLRRLRDRDSYHRDVREADIGVRR